MEKPLNLKIHKGDRVVAMELLARFPDNSVNFLAITEMGLFYTIEYNIRNPEKSRVFQTWAEVRTGSKIASNGN